LEDITTQSSPGPHDDRYLWELEAKGSEMFLGEYERSLDDKSRLALPAELRPGLEGGAVMTRSFDKCLCIYPAARWDALARAVDDLPEVRHSVRVLARGLFGSAVPCQFDRQGRVVVPSFLREYADLHGEVVVAGVGSRVEIWDREAWLQQRQQFEAEGSRIAEELSISLA
jgi:MraZ protein